MASNSSNSPCDACKFLRESVLQSVYSGCIFIRKNLKNLPMLTRSSQQATWTKLSTIWRVTSGSGSQSSLWVGWSNLHPPAIGATAYRKHWWLPMQISFSTSLHWSLFLIYIIQTPRCQKSYSWIKRNFQNWPWESEVPAMLAWLSYVSQIMPMPANAVCASDQ